MDGKQQRRGIPWQAWPAWGLTLLYWLIFGNSAPPWIGIVLFAVAVFFSIWTSIKRPDWWVG